jgi:hypothetical protein
VCWGSVQIINTFTLYKFHQALISLWIRMKKYETTTLTTLCTLFSCSVSLFFAMVAVSPELVIFAQGIWAQAQGRRGPVQRKT